VHWSVPQPRLWVLDVDGVLFDVRQQVKMLRGKPVFAPPKGGKTREVPLPDVVAFALAERVHQWPAREVALPWRELGSQPTTAELVFVTREGGPLTRRHYNVNVWKRALVAAEVEPTRANGMHALRHHFASALLDGGVSIRALAEYLGHSDPVVHPADVHAPDATQRGPRPCSGGRGPRSSVAWPRCGPGSSLTGISAGQGLRH
jgi:integrase